MNWQNFQTRFYAALIIIALVTATVSIVVSSHETRTLSENIVEDNLWRSAENYFDSINTLMISGLMTNRAILQQKLMSHDDILEARVIRSATTQALYGPGMNGQSAADALDQRALDGEQFSVIETTPEGRSLTVLMPVRALTDYSGTNCLTCHANANEGDVLGVVRLTENLNDIDANVSNSVRVSSLLQFGILMASFLILLVFTRQTLIRRLRILRDDLSEISEQLDFTRTFDLQRKDEIGHVYQSMTKLMASVRTSLNTVAQASNNVLSVSRQVREGADMTEQAVNDQKQGTESVAAAVNQMDVSAGEVRERTQSAATESSKATTLTEQSIRLSDETQSGLNGLVADIQHSAEVIHQLDERTQSVGSILESIGAIAEQTNLLALNAAIEAARAGEQGRGFAVVADEVRQLANRTHDSTENIKATLSALQTEAAQATGAMNHSTTQATQLGDDVTRLISNLRDIAAQVRDIEDLNTQIADATQQQNTAADEINQNASRIRDNADHSEALAMSSKQHSEALVESTEALESAIRRFKID